MLKPVISAILCGKGCNFAPINSPDDRFCESARQHDKRGKLALNTLAEVATTEIYHQNVPLITSNLKKQGMLRHDHFQKNNNTIDKDKSEFVC